MRANPFMRFTDDEVREILRGSGLPEDLDEDNIARVGIEPIRTQREKVLAAYRRNPDVDTIFDALGGRVPKSSIRSYLSRASDIGEVGNEWRQRRRRRSRHG